MWVIRSHYMTHLRAPYCNIVVVLITELRWKELTTWSDELQVNQSLPTWQLSVFMTKTKRGRRKPIQRNEPYTCNLPYWTSRGYEGWPKYLSRRRSDKRFNMTQHVCCPKGWKTQAKEWDLWLRSSCMGKTAVAEDMRQLSSGKFSKKSEQTYHFPPRRKSVDRGYVV